MDGEPWEKEIEDEIFLPFYDRSVNSHQQPWRWLYEQDDKLLRRYSGEVPIRYFVLKQIENAKRIPT
jgi:hypothetical protein